MTSVGSSPLRLQGAVQNWSTRKSKKDWREAGSADLGIVVSGARNSPKTLACGGPAEKHSHFSRQLEGAQEAGSGHQDACAQRVSALRALSGRLRIGRWLPRRTGWRTVPSEVPELVRRLLTCRVQLRCKSVVPLFHRLLQQ